MVVALIDYHQAIRLPTCPLFYEKTSRSKEAEKDNLDTHVPHSLCKKTTLAKNIGTY